MVQQKILSNGIRVLFVPMPESMAATVLVLVATGSKYETAELSGISHFLEHLCFKGTTRRPRAIDISRELDALGAQYNAFTSHEYTGYYAKVDWRHFHTALDVVSDIYTASTFPDAEIQKEKGVIVEEIRMYRDLPHYRVHDVYRKLLYGNQPAGWDIAGTEQTVMSFTRDDFVRYHQGHYVTESTVLVVAGRFDERAVWDDAERLFGSLPQSAALPKQPVMIDRSGARVAVEEKGSDQAHLVLGVRTFDTYDARNPALRVIASLLGGGMSSRLFEKLRNELGICYYVSVDADSYTDHGSLDIAAGVDTARIAIAVEAIIDQLMLLTTQTVSPGELQKAKDYLVGSLALSLETSSDMASYFGGQAVLKKPIQTASDVAERISAVTADDVQRLAREIFVKGQVYAALVGPGMTAEQLASVLDSK